MLVPNNGIAKRQMLSWGSLTKKVQPDFVTFWMFSLEIPITGRYPQAQHEKNTLWQFCLLGGKFEYYGFPNLTPDLLL